MCGIFAISRSDPSSFKSGYLAACNAALAIEGRGRHATGFAWHDPEGWPWSWKVDEPASLAVMDAPLPKLGLRSVIGHTRHATLGDPAVNSNNHPVVAPGIVLVHNGRVDNHEELAALSGLPREAEVDSVTLAMLLASPDFAECHPVELLELVEGVAAIAWLDADDPHAIHLARLSTRPMALGSTRRGDLIMSSTLSTLRETAARAHVTLAQWEIVPEGTYLRVEAGRVTDRVGFKVRHPKVEVVEDVPGATPATPSKRKHREPSFVDADGIDWGQLVPRRGWK